MIPDRPGTEAGDELLSIARAVLRNGAEALLALEATLDARFLAAVELLATGTGRIVVTGMGKSGLVGGKIAATLRSTGSPASFLHPAEALHGDIGLVAPDDVVVALSRSGRTAELGQLLPLLQRLDVPIVALTADESSPLALAARVVLPIGRPREAGPADLVPTSSTTAMLALGDALAMALLRRRGFTVDSLAFVHPAGVIGRQAARRVESLMHAGPDLPRVPGSATLREALLEIIQKKLGITTVVDGAGRLTGVLTDGDLKRILVRPDGIAALDRPVAEVMSHPPRVVAAETSIAVAVREMEDPRRGPVTALVVLSDSGEPLGVLHLHDCLKPA